MDCILFTLNVVTHYTCAGMDFTDKVRQAKIRLNYNEIRPFQMNIIEQYYNGHDVFATAPTGSGKSLTYEIAPIILGKTVMIVQPLLALIADQMQAFTSKQFSVCTVSDVQSSDIHSMDFIFGTPEAFFENRDILKSSAFRQQIGLIVVDESHCIQKL